MIALRWENLYNVMNAISAITAKANIFSYIPFELNGTPTGSYIYFSIQDSPDTFANQWLLFKQATVSFYIVCKQTLWPTESHESVIMDIVDAVNNAILPDGCNKITLWDGIYVNNIREWGQSPIWFLPNDRAVMSKDYVFIYSPQDPI